MKKKSINSFITFSLVLIMILFFFQSLTNSESLNKAVSEPVSIPAEIHPVVGDMANQLIQRTAEKGIVIVITDDFRSAEEQDSLYEKGRSIEGNIVTHAKGGESYHNWGLAIDFAIKTPSGEVIWDMKYDGNGNAKADWDEVVEIAKSLGFEWGGDWVQFKDYPHFQFDYGLTIAELQSGERPPDSPLTADIN